MSIWLKLVSLKSNARRNEWIEAIESEITSLVKNDIGKNIQIDNSYCKNVVVYRLMLTYKQGLKGETVRRKAHLVAKGWYSQRCDLDYYQTFALVARLETLRLLLALAVQFDIVTAYLNRIAQAI